MKAAVQQTRGLNRNFNHTPKCRHYEQLLDGGTKPNLAKLTLARQIAAIVLALWSSGEAYDQRDWKRRSNAGRSRQARG